MLKKLLNNFISLYKSLISGKSGIDSKTARNLSFDSLRLLGNKQNKLEEIHKDASSLVKQHHNDVNGLLEFIERRGTRVIRKQNADIIVKLLGKEEGFIPPMKGIRGKLIMFGLKLIGAWNGEIKDTTPAIFVFGSKTPQMGYVIHQLHHWLCYNKGLPGYTEETINNFQKIFDPAFGMEDIQKMTKEEMIALREAIARDQEALDFVQKMAQEIFKPQDIIKGIKEGDSQNI